MCKVLKKARYDDLEELILINWKAQNSVTDAIKNSHGRAKKVLENEIVKLILEENRLVNESEKLARELGIE